MFLSLLSIPILLVVPTLAQPPPLKNLGTVTFDCVNMPEVCNNMCWGVHCRNGRYTHVLTYSGPNSALSQKRRKSAGCGPNNRCSYAAPYKNNKYSCDEFPFANSAEADTGLQSNRCVPVRENNKQGGKLGAFVNRMAAEQKRLDPNPGPGAYKKHIPFQYTIAFGNPTTAGVRYCSNALIANPCISDANQLEGPNNVQSPNPGKWTPRSLAQSVTMPEFNHYISRRGDLISMPQNVEPGHVLWRPEIIPSVKAKARATTDEEELQALYEDPESYILIEDEISHWVSPEHVRSLSNKAS